MNTPSSDTQNIKPKMFTFTFAAPAARQVSLAGYFNNWNPRATPMCRGVDGVWRVSVLIDPAHGEHQIYVDGVWHDDPAELQKTTDKARN